jgi:hypothetical protein
VKGIMIRRFMKIKKFKRIRIQPLCGEHPSWVPNIYLLGGVEDFIARLNDYIH